MTIKRVSLLQDLLAFIGIEGRLHLAWISSAEAQRFVQVVTDFTEKIRSRGPSPLSACYSPPHLHIGHGAGSALSPGVGGEGSLPAEAAAQAGGEGAQGCPEG